MKYHKSMLLLFFAAIVFCFGCGNGDKQKSNDKPMNESVGNNRVTVKENGENVKTEIPEHIYKFYVNKAEIRADKLLPELISGYDRMKKQVRREEGPEGTKFTLIADGINYEWAVDKNVIIFQRLSEASGPVPDQQDALESCNQILENLGFQEAAEPEIVLRAEEGTEYYDIKYKFFYEDMKILWDFSFESPYDPQAEVGITGEELEISYDAQGIKAFFIYGLRSVGEVKETVAPEELISADRAVELFEEYMTEFQKNFETDGDGGMTGKYTLEQAELIYIPLPDQETKSELMIPAWYLKVNCEEHYRMGQEKQTIETVKDVLIDAVTGYVYKAD